MPLSTSLWRRPATGFAVLLTAFAAWATADWYLASPASALADAHYVGRASCVKCHQAEAEAFHDSDHDRAMDLATDETVLGDFNNAQFTRYDETARFFRDGQKFMVNAEGPDGKYRDYEVKYTFGVRPLQQYMVEFPDGRVQVLRVSWDVRNKKWFYVAPVDAAEERLEPGDPLHWTGLAQNWNTMCAECHVTDYHKNYDLASNTYKSTYKEIDVSCETCHGPGSVHVALAESKSLFWDRKLGYGLTNSLKGASNRRQVETCAPCHSRRTIIHADYRAGDAYLDHFEPSLLAGSLYHSDGQILDEVYEWGSFTQSKMYHKGVRCTDCHDAHSLRLKFNGNRMCAQCHQPGKYDGAGHHHHPNAAAGAAETQCVTCHMPTSVYMGIDERRDHSLHVPRPDLTVKLGTPNVCNRCHAKPEEDAQWAADAVVKWYGAKRPDDPHFAPALHAAQRGDPEGGALLRRIIRREQTPEIVRATAVELLGRYGSAEDGEARRDAIADPSPLVRAAALRASTEEFLGVSEELKQLRAEPRRDVHAVEREAELPRLFAELVQDVAPKLDDRVRSVRLAAANLLVANAEQLANSPFGRALHEAIEEYKAAQTIHLDRAQSSRNLGDLSLRLGDGVAAVKHLRTAIRQEPYLTGPRTELSQVLAQMLADPRGAEDAKKVGASADEVRQLREEEVGLLERDAKLLPNDPFPHYRRGRLLYLLGREDDAREALAEAARLGPNEYEYWMWLALICERQQRWEEAVAALKQMARLRPEAEEWKGIGARIRQTILAQGEDDAAAAPEVKTNQPPAAVEQPERDTSPLPPPPVMPGQKQTPSELQQE